MVENFFSRDLIRRSYCTKTLSTIGTNGPGTAAEESAVTLSLRAHGNIKQCASLFDFFLLIALVTASAIESRGYLIVRYSGKRPIAHNRCHAEKPNTPSSRQAWRHRHAATNFDRDPGKLLVGLETIRFMQTLPSSYALTRDTCQ